MRSNRIRSFVPPPRRGAPGREPRGHCQHSARTRADRRRRNDRRHPAGRLPSLSRIRRQGRYETVRLHEARRQRPAPAQPTQGRVSLQQITACPECAGRGVIIDTPCPECGGKGQVAHEDALTVRIPIGVEDGMALRVPGHGWPPEKHGLPPGDLFVVVRTADDPRFERHGRDLYRVEPVDVVDAVLGASIDVPTLDGQVSVNCPPARSRIRRSDCAERGCHASAEADEAICTCGCRCTFRNGCRSASGVCSSR
jgi:hypothetical protein